MLLDTRKRYRARDDISRSSLLAGAGDKRHKPLLVPVSVWRTFPRLKLALDFSVHCFQDVAVFAYENKELTNPGGRRFLVTTYYEFGQRYILMKSPRHFYEVITEGSVCHLYFDLEYSILLNPDTNSLHLLDTFKQYVSCQLKYLFNVSCGPQHVLDMDSTTDEKFSRHLIYHLQEAAFRNNLIVGKFVKHICDRLRVLRDTGMGAESSNSWQDIVHLNRGPYQCSCPSGEELLKLFVTTSKGTSLIVDEGVYTRNRNFRLLLSTKKGKKVKLTVSKESCFKSSHAVDSSKRKWSKLFNDLMDSLVCNVRFEATATILDSPFCEPIKSAKPVSTKKHVATATPREGGTCDTPYPSIDQFITSQLVKDGLTGRIREWTYFSQGKLIVYEISGYRWCENIGRHHKSNNVMMVADLKTATYYQKCHDPDCRRIDFRSKSYPIPQDIIELYRDEGGEEGADRSKTRQDSEMKRVMLSDFRDNDSFTDDCLPPHNAAEAAPRPTSPTEERSDKQEMLFDLSVEELLGTESELDELEQEISQELCSNLSYDDVFSDQGELEQEIGQRKLLDNLSYEELFEDDYSDDQFNNNNNRHSSTMLDHNTDRPSQEASKGVSDEKIFTKQQHKLMKIKGEPQFDTSSITEHSQFTNEAKAKNDDKQFEDELLQDLSYEDLFDAGSDEDEVTVSGLLGDLSYEDLFQDNDDGTQDGSSLFHSTLTSTPIKQEPVSSDGSRDSHMTNTSLQLVKTEVVNDDEDSSFISLSQQEMKSFLDFND